MTTGGTTFDKVTAGLQEWYAGPKSPGLIILEHELTNDTVNAFIQNVSTFTSSLLRL
jgi:chitin deacetylase